MLDMIRHAQECQPVAECSPSRNERESIYNRNMQEDIQTGIGYIFDLQNKLNKLHPAARDVLVKLLKVGY